jgi:hypothetical protein
VRTRPIPALLLPILGLTCTLVIDNDRFDDGTTAGLGGGGAPPIATSSETTTTVASSSSTGLTGTCVPSLFHVGFEEPVETWRPNVLFLSGASAGEVIGSPTRRGDAAWRIALGETQKYTFLRTAAPDEEDTSYWMGWSQIYEGPTITDGTRLFDVVCSFPEDPYEVKIFALEMDPGTPSLPYRAWGVAPELNEDGGGTGVDELDDIPNDSEFHDWAAHMKLSHGEDGFFELYHEGQLVFSAHGPTLTELCEGTIFARWGLYRWQGWGDGGADMAPPQSTVLDEITLIKGPDAPNTDADALYTLDPDSGCF